VGLMWLGRIVVACLHREATNSYELCLYPRYHLDESSLLCRLPLSDRPIAMDTWQDYILVATMPFDIRVFHIHVDGELSPLKTPPVRVRGPAGFWGWICKDYSMMTALVTQVQGLLTGKLKADLGVILRSAMSNLGASKIGRPKQTLDPLLPL
jgi:hypothetical protein